jgi:cytoskeletal protein CcmA (bactofilin family)
VSADDQVLVAKGGRVEGDVHAREAVLDGEVMGSVVAEERVEIQASAVIRGDIVTPRLMVHEGAILDVQVGKPKAASIAQRGAA